MNAIELLTKRQSDPQLTSPAPNKEQLDTIFQAAVRVPDHAALAPYRFIVAQEKGLEKLAQAYVKALEEKGADQAKLDKAAKMPFRAPMVITIVTQYQEHEKVPHSEQLITAGCAAHAMQMAAYSLGLGAMWRTGDLAFNDTVKQELGIELNEDIVGFLYIGTKAKEMPEKPQKSFDDRVEYL